MNKQPKIVKRQQDRVIESKTDSVPTSESSFSKADESVESAEPAVLEQSFKSVEPQLPAGTDSAIDSSPLPYYPAVYSPAFSVWSEELKEIRYEYDLDVWESCPYD